MSVRVLLAASLVACAPPLPPAAPVIVNSSANVEVAGSAPPMDDAPPGWGTVQVLVDKRVPRPTEVIAVFDFHSDAANADKGFDELRARAAAVGADAVIGAEFEHGDGGEPSHLSGVAVRFLDH